MRDLDQNPSAVARLRVAARRPAVRQIDQHLQALADNVVAANAANIGDQPHSTRIMFIPRVIESLRLWCAGTTIRSLHGNLLA